MIPISYDLEKQEVRDALVPYNDFVRHFKNKTIEGAIKRGYVGHKRLDKNGNDITQYLDASDRKLLQWIRDNLERIAHLDAERLTWLIEKMEKDYGVTKHGDNRKRKILYHLFVECGYDGGAFPKDALIKATGLDTCPYCNSENVDVVLLRKIENGKPVTKNVKGQLDHFYCKSLYPYLAISRDNLVPCCSTCNGYPNKHTVDALVTGLVSPYVEKSFDTLLFRLSIPCDLYGTKIEEKQCDIQFDVSQNRNYNSNIAVFGLSDLYNARHKYVAIRVYNAFLFRNNLFYLGSIEQQTQNLPNQQNATYEILKETWGVVADKNKYRKERFSKLATDIWQQLEAGL